MKAERFDRWMLLGGLLAALVGLKAYVIFRFGTDLPFMDQWAKEGDMVIAPAREGILHLRDLFVPHSEHRIVPTLLVNLGLVQWAGQWDARVACVVNAVIHSLVMVSVTAYVFRAYSRGAALAAGWLQLGLAATALDWENTLISFQSQFYFLLGFSLVAIWGLLDPRGWAAPRWWTGLLAGACATISMGSGLLCFAPVALVAGLRLLRSGVAERSKRFGLGPRTGPETLGAFRYFRRGAGSRTEAETLGAFRDLRREAGSRTEPEAVGASRSAVRTSLTLAVALAALAIGWFTRGIAPWEIPLHATRVGDFLLYFLHCLGWPAHGWGLVIAVLWLPWLAFVGQRVERDLRARLTSNRVLAQTQPMRPPRPGDPPEHQPSHELAPALQAHDAASVPLRDPAIALRRELLLAAGIWVLLQMAAVSFYRGVGGGYPASRYCDIFQLGLVINVLVWFERPGRWPRPFQLLLALWVMLLVAGVAAPAVDTWRSLLPSIAGRSRVYEADVGQYVRTGDVSRLHPPHLIPFPDADWFKRMIDRPSLRAVLPVSVNAARVESSASGAVWAFCRRSGWLAAGGIALVLGATALTWRRTE